MSSNLNKNISVPWCLYLRTFYDVPKQHRIVLAFTASMLSVTSITSNSLLIYSLYRTHLYKTISTKFVIAMNISDLLTGILVLPLLLNDFLKNIENEYCVNISIIYASQYLGCILGYFSSFMLFTVAGDRYLHVTRLNLYSTYMNDFKMKVIIAGSLLLANIVALFRHFIPSFKLQLVLNAIGVSLLICSYYFYYTLIRCVNRHSVKSRVNISRAQRLDISMAKTVKLLISFAAITYIPYFVTSSIRAYYKHEKRLNPGIHLDLAVLWSYMIFLSNGSLNSILYGYIKQIRESIHFQMLSRT